MHSYNLVLKNRNYKWLNPIYINIKRERKKCSDLSIERVINRASDQLSEWSISVHYIFIYHRQIIKLNEQACGNCEARRNGLSIHWTLVGTSLSMIRKYYFYFDICFIIVFRLGSINWINTSQFECSRRRRRRRRKKILKALLSEIKIKVTHTIYLYLAMKLIQQLDEAKESFKKRSGFVSSNKVQ